MASSSLKIAIVGGGLAGLAAAMKIAEAGHEVDIISVVPVKRSHSVCAQGGINGAVNTKGEGDSPTKHLDDTVYGGDFLANQPPVKRMTDMAPEIINLFDRMGVPFSRTKEGLMDFRRFGGTLHHRTAFSGASTGQQLLYALDEQVRRWEVEKMVTKWEGWEMLSLIMDDHQVCRGLVAMNLQTLELKSFAADAVAFETDLEYFAGRDVARDEIAVCRIFFFEEVPAFAIRNVLGLASVHRITRNPDAAAFAAGRFAH